MHIFSTCTHYVINYVVCTWTNCNSGETYFQEGFCIIFKSSRIIWQCEQP